VVADKDMEKIRTNPEELSTILVLFGITLIEKNENYTYFWAILQSDSNISFSIFYILRIMNFVEIVANMYIVQFYFFIYIFFGHYIKFVINV